MEQTWWASTKHSERNVEILCYCVCDISNYHILVACNLQIRAWLIVGRWMGSIFHHFCCVWTVKSEWDSLFYHFYCGKVVLSVDINYSFVLPFLTSCVCNLLAQTCYLPNVCHCQSPAHVLQCWLGCCCFQIKWEREGVAGKRRARLH